MKFKKATAYFFDSKLVEAKTDRATRGVLSRFGSFVRRTARHSIRKRKKVSQRGKPPSSHKPHHLRNKIFFAYDPSAQGVVIGPVQLAGRAGDAPRVLEAGGTVRRKLRGRVVTAHYDERPYMGPAFEKEKPKVSSLWAGSVKA